MAGFGLAAVIISPLKAGQLIPTWGVEGTLLILGIVASGVSWIAAGFIRNPPQGWTAPAAKGPTPSAPRPVATERTPPEMVRTPLFYLIWGTFALVQLGGLLAIGLIVPYGKLTLGLSPGHAAWAMSLFALVNGLGRPLAGFLGDRFGSVRVMIGTYVVQTVVFLVFPLLAVTPVGYYLSSTLLGWGFAVTLALFPAVTAFCFGVRNLGANYGLVFTAFGVGALGPVVGSWLYDLFGTYTPAFLLAGGTTGLGLGLAMALKTRHRLP
jgi:OFA family oxalate/formate antiporter-like MFS transporter